MTRKDYEAFAAALGQSYANAITHAPALSPVAALNDIRARIESIFRADNGRFDVERFRAAVGSTVTGGAR